MAVSYRRFRSFSSAFITIQSSSPRTTFVNFAGSVCRCAEIDGSEAFESDSRVLGRTSIREIVYRALREDQDGALRALANRDGNFIRIAKVLKEVHADSAKPITVESMAKRAGMSIAAFHHNFKLVAGSSPLQYLKRIRLDRAKRLMMYDGYNASTAAKAVGYESASQFSREFKRQFGVSPMERVEHPNRTSSKASAR